MNNNDKSWKIVYGNTNNDDQELIGFYTSERHATESIPYILRKYGNWIESRELLFVKPTDPERICKPVDSDYMHYVQSLIPKNEWERVMRSDASAEIYSNFLMCGGATYYYLSRMIPKHWNVIDIGASYGAQSYLFQQHRKYIAVEPFEHCEMRIENFKAKGTERYTETAGKFISDVLPYLGLDIRQTFAICNYVPEWFGDNPTELVRKTFHNCYTFYPA